MFLVFYRHEPRDGIGAREKGVGKDRLKIDYFRFQIERSGHVMTSP